MSYKNIAAARYAADAPVSTDLLADMVANEDYLNTNQNAPQDVGGSPNIVNGSFELDASGTGTPSGWNFTAGTGGTGAVTNTQQNHGAKSYLVTQDNTTGHTGGVLDGPYSSGNQYMNVSPSLSYQVTFMLKCSRADVANSCVLNWYDASQSFLSSTTVKSIANGSSPTSWTVYTTGNLVPPASAEFCRLICNLGSDNVTPPGQSTNIYIDGISIRPRTPFSTSQVFTSTGSFTVPSGVFFLKFRMYGSTSSASSGVWGGYGETIASVKPGDVATITISNTAAASSTIALNGTTYTVTNGKPSTGPTSGTSTNNTVNVTGGSGFTAVNFILEY